MNAPEMLPMMRSRPLSDHEQAYYAGLIDDLKALRQAKGISQAEMDHRLGVSEGCVAKWESCARLPGAFFLMCWTQALDGRLTIEKEIK